jgi:hypothetical protein
VSWLFVASIPALLMLATFGLERLESSLSHDCVDAADVAEFLAQAQPSDMNTLARTGLAEALDGVQRRRIGHIEPATEVENASRARREHAYAGSNPQFRPARHVDSV